MARPTMKEERREQILLAFERCVARYGVEGAVLERVAKEAGLARPLIRHNVGNRDDLIAQLVDRYFTQSEAQWNKVIDSLPGVSPASVLVELLFNPEAHDPQLVLLTEALIAHAAQDKDLAHRMQHSIDTTLDQIIHVIGREFPEAEPARQEAVAAGILGLYFNVDSFSIIGNTARLRTASKSAAAMLLHSLRP